MTTHTHTRAYTQAVVSQTGVAFDTKFHTGHRALRFGGAVPLPRSDREDDLRELLDEADAEITRQGYVRIGGWTYAAWSGGLGHFRSSVTRRTEKVAVGSVEYYDQFPGFWSSCETVEAWLKAHPGQLYNPSTIARRAKVDSNLVYTVLRYLDEHSVIAADGNGCWRKYAAKRS